MSTEVMKHREARSIDGCSSEGKRSSRMIHKAVTYSLGFEVSLFADKASRRLRFVPALADPTEHLVYDLSDEVVHETEPAADRLIANRFWYVQYGEKPRTTLCAVLSTVQMMTLLDERRTLFVISGPFTTKQEAEYDADVRWESPG